MTEFNRERAKQLISEAKARQYSQHELELAKLLEQALGFDVERRTYYDNYVLVKNDWNILRAALTKLTPVLKAFRESDHSYHRAPTQEGQAVLDAWDEVGERLAVRDAELRKLAFIDNRVVDSDKSGE
jgi:hypothetical protein